MGRIKHQDVDDLIPISESVRILDEKYEHLRNISWNSRDDEEDDKPIKRGSKLSKQS
jgi:hypothetical protein